MKLDSFPQDVRLAVAAALEKKAASIAVLDLTGLGAFTQYFVICTGFSRPQVQAICSEVEELLHKKLARSPEHREGHHSAEWALLDFGSFVVHVFSEQARRYYDLERLWRSAPKFDVPDPPGPSENVVRANSGPDSSFRREHRPDEAAS
jgi:ribosome-associated protein